MQRRSKIFREKIRNFTESSLGAKQHFMKRIAKVLLGFNGISLIHLLHLNPKQFLRACSRAFTTARRITPSEIPEINLGKILGDRKPIIRFSVRRWEDGMLPSEQTMALLAILVAEAPKVVLEIGTFMGQEQRAGACAPRGGSRGSRTFQDRERLRPVPAPLLPRKLPAAANG
jgi:hypothetical protein